jgi:hypothetical protein
MRITIDQPQLLPDLARFLEQRGDTVVVQVDETALEVNLLGSMSDEAMRIELDLRIGIWRATSGQDVGVVVSVGDS